MTTPTTRRDFLKSTGILAAGLTVTGMSGSALIAADSEPLYKISLAEWSLHRALFAKEMDHLDFAKVTKEEFGIDAVEYVNQFFKDKARDEKYLSKMKQRAEDHGVKSLLIMVDGEGRLGDADKAKRKQAVENHHQWVEAAKFLGCHAVRVNAGSTGTYEEQQDRAADGLRQLTEFAEPHQIAVIVENHGGLSSNGEWLAGVMQKVDHPNCGTLPDFGNFRIKEGEVYDRYKGVKELMPYAKAVSAKSHEFEDGREVHTDFHRMMKIVVDAGYHGYVGIEWEGSAPSEYEGIRLTKKLLEAVRDDLSA